MSEPTPSRPGADRNLLFGLLALQRGLISADALVAALNAWVCDKNKTLGQVLVLQQELRPEQHAELIALLNKHLEYHGQDARRCLAAVSPTGPVRQQLEQIADDDLRACLTCASAAGPDDTLDQQTQPPAAGAAAAAGPRFRVLRPHAQGGLGQVSVALDGELHREVALKEIQGRWAGDPDSRARFLLEAEITGRLEHPGVVPVYGQGCYPDGRPFYAMRLIKGDSLKEAIARFHATEGPRRAPGERALALRELLGRFVAVCNTVAYAHSRGILHRDLKPANVMLGPYGETLVVDWGLAKVVGRPEGAAESAETTLRPGAASDSGPTQVGAALGTPAYMSPEQAAGRLDELGPPSDVYSLGATLYHLLTGRAPFAGPAVLPKVQRGEFPPPRQVKRDVPPALEAVCLKAMARRPEDRYPSPLDLKGDIEHWLADEPVSAWREPWRLRARRWARRHRSLALAAATAALLAVVAGASSSSRPRWW